MKPGLALVALLFASVSAHAIPGDFEAAVRGEFTDVKVGGATVLAATAPDDAALNRAQLPGQDNRPYALDARAARAENDVRLRADQACRLVGGTRAITYVLDPGVQGPYVTVGSYGAIVAAPLPLLQPVMVGPNIAGVAKGFTSLKCAKQ